MSKTSAEHQQKSAGHVRHILRGLHHSKNPRLIRLIPCRTFFSVYEQQILNPVGQNVQQCQSRLLAREGVALSLLNSYMGMEYETGDSLPRQRSRV